MSEIKLEFIGKQVKDMYGTKMGNVIGVITDTDGSIESVSVDCGHAGLKQLLYEQLLVQGEFVIYIPRWRLDAQKLFRQKNLILKRIKALQDIVSSEDDIMKEDAQIVYTKYEKRLLDLQETEKEINEKLNQRLIELDNDSINIKAALFDAKLQYRSNEITEDAYQHVNLHTKDLSDRINLEKEEIQNIKNRLEQQNLQNTVMTANGTQSISSAIEDNKTEKEADILPNVSEVEIESEQVAINLPLPEDTSVTPNIKTTKSTSNDDAIENESNWLEQVISK